MKSKHPDVSVERKVRGPGKKVKTEVSSVINVGTCLQIVEVWIDMSQRIIQIIQHSTVISA